jgi:hypothetical protein
MVSTFQPESAEGGIGYSVSCRDAGTVSCLMTGSTSSFVDPCTGKVLFPMGHIVHVFTDQRRGITLVALERKNNLRIYLSPINSDLNP